MLSTTYFKIFYFLVALILTGFVFQNCSATGINTQQSSSLSGSSYCSGHAADPVCLQSVAKRCNFNSVIMFEGRTVTAFLNSTATASGTCKSEVRKCSGGVLSGSFSYATCSVGAAKSCLFDGKTVASGATVDAYLNSTEPAGGVGCRMEKRTCTDGALSGTYLYSSCQVAAANSCLFAGATIPHGQPVTAFERANVPFGSMCIVKTRTCYNGALDGTGDFSKCAVGQPNSCQFAGQTFLHSEHVVGFAEASVPYGGTCIAKNRTCNAGNFIYDDGTAAASTDTNSCQVAQPKSCTLTDPAGQPSIPHAGSIDLYMTQNSVDGVCATERRTCTNGVLSGSAHYLSCTILATTVTPPPPTPSPVPPQTFYYANDANLSHQVGIQNEKSWSVNSNTAGFLTYGPYRKDLAAGVYTVSFTLSIDDVSKDQNAVASMDVYDSTSKRVLVRRAIPRTSFLQANAPQDFDLVFETNGPSILEFRVYTPGIIGLRHLSTKLIPDRLDLNSLWQKQSHFEFKNENHFSYNSKWDGNTASLVTLDGVWYAFNRQYEGTNMQCPAGGAMIQTVVRKSTDQGATWTDPVVVATSAHGSSAMSDNCMITDGSAFFDTETSTWHLLIQCMGTTGGWNLCHYSRAGNSPLGEFIRDATGPSVKSGELWKQICGVGKHCPSDTTDEGTPQIIKKMDDYYYVSFHGFHAADLNGYRGMARTKDFKLFETSAVDLPNDAFLSAQDCSSWVTGCIGFGDASTLRSGLYNYTIAEAANKSLGCTAGQDWVAGFKRSPTYAISGGWENYADNPFIVNQRISPSGCAIQYINLFRDRGEIFLSFGYFSPAYHYPNKNYRLESGVGSAKIIVQ